MKKRTRVTRPHVDDPSGYVVSINYGDELEHYETLERAVWQAKAALREGVESAQVWHRLVHNDGSYSLDVDPNQECEYGGHQRDANDNPDWLDR